MTQATLYIGLNISIHAPPRGATRAAGGSGSHSGNFNSRPSARGDLNDKDEKRQTMEFQFTPLREGRP